MCGHSRKTEPVDALSELVQICGHFANVRRGEADAVRISSECLERRDLALRKEGNGSASHYCRRKCVCVVVAERNTSD